MEFAPSHGDREESLRYDDQAVGDQDHVIDVTFVLPRG
jgi:hypothetical protein